MHENTTPTETPARAIEDERAHDPEAALLTLTRRLLAAEPALGRLLLAYAARQLRRYADEAAAAPHRDHVGKLWRAQHMAAWADRYEAEQRGRGFGNGADELAAAEAAVEPEPVTVEPPLGHGALLATIYQDQPRRPGVVRAGSDYVHARAEYRDDRRWKGAYVEAEIDVGDAGLRVGRRVEDPGAVSAAAALVGRWARIGRALLALP